MDRDEGQPVEKKGMKRLRYHWPLRLFIAFFLFDMFTRSFLAVTDHLDWDEDLAMSLTPAVPLPTQAELGQIDRGEHPKYRTRGDRFRASFESLGRFYNPAPTEKTREKIESAGDWAKYGTLWLHSRLKLYGRMVGVDQAWPMFGRVAKGNLHARYRLEYEDGSKFFYQGLSDPKDPTNFVLLFREKELQIFTKAHKDYDTRLGVCNWLSHKYAVNESESKLKKIFVYNIDYDFPAPDEDAYAYWASLRDPPAELISADKHEYDVASGRLWRLKEKKGAE